MGSFIWAALRANWTLFLIGFVIDLIALMNLSLYFKYVSQFAPDERNCIRQDRAVAAGEEVPFKAKFDCFMIGEFPILIWIDRPDKVAYPRDENGERTVLRAPRARGHHR